MSNRQVNQGIRTGGRSARVREMILKAVFSELLANGYAALTVEAVAASAGVNKTTIYRRWPTLDDLMADAMLSWSSEAIPIPDTGGIETDLLALATELAEQLNGGIGRQFAAVVLTAGLRSPHLGEATRRYFAELANRAKPIVDRAIDRGEVAPNTDATALIDTLRAPFFYRAVTTGEPVDDVLIAQSVRITAMAAQAGLLSA